MQTISVKELREKFPLVRSELKKGESFLIIHKSKPIAELRPVPEVNGRVELSDKYFLKDVEAAAAEDWKKLPPITKEEYDYYMSLSPYKNTD